jgi:hypothetical protein
VRAPNSMFGRKRAAPLHPCVCRFHKPSPQPSLCNTFAKRTMRWPGSGTDDDKKKHVSESWVDSLTDVRTVIPTIALTVTSVAAARLYKTYLRRIPSVNHIKPNYFRRKGVFGQVTSVGDADNFRLYHTPGGRIAGWGWLPWKRVPKKRDGLTNQTVGLSLRLASQIRVSTTLLRLLTRHSFTFGSLASMLRSLLTGDEKRSHIRKKRMIGSST